MSDKTRFKVVRGYDNAIQQIPYTDGQVYFAIDTGRIYIDAKDKNKFPVGGGNGVIIHYGQIPKDIEPVALNTYSITLSMLEDQDTKPNVGDLILNSDGTFYRITKENTDTYECIKVLVGGDSSGGGGSSIGQAMSLIARRETPSSTVLNGQSVPVTITATSAKDVNGVDLDTEIYLTYTIYVSDGGALGTAYQTGALNDLPSGESLTYDFGPELRESTSSIIVISATSGSSDKPKTTRVPVNCVEMQLTQAANFSNLNVFYNNEALTLACNAIGNLNKILEFSFDDQVIETLYLTPSSAQEQKYQIPANSDLLTHGVHTIKFSLYQDVNPIKHVKGLSTDPISMEIAVVDKTNPKPIIWLGDYKTEYKAYDDIQIPFKVYNNGETTAIVRFSKNNQKESERTITISSQFEVYEIATADQDTLNYYTISCGSQDNEVQRNIIFTVVEDTEHDMTNPQAAFLQLNFDAKGRSNDESSTARATWTDSIHGKKAVFKNFNWVNNGWIFDSGATSLKISNGASFEIPFGSMVFNGGAATNTSNSFDFQFKVSNIQRYSNLITKVTRYKNDNKFYAAYQKKKDQYNSYDSYLGANLPAEDDAGNIVTYDDLQFDRVDRIISLDDAICSYYDGNDKSVQGLCIGPQDVFFSNGANTVSADFVEDEMVYLTIVYDGSKKNADGQTTPMMSIYVNGVLTGVVKTDLASKFTIGANDENKAIVFNSNVCDIDLYKVRFYNTALTVNDVVMNYAIDTKNITTYDQNKLAEYDNNIQEFRLKYQNVLEYNIAHSKDPLMPYVIFDTSKSNNNDRLPFSKKFNVTAGMEFHNTPLELAYSDGELEDLAVADGLMKRGERDASVKEKAVKTYYLHHCPSFTAENVNLAVQGTSSEFYPRRNYKVKTKTKYDDDGVERVHFWINGGPYAKDFEENGTARDTEEVKDSDGKITTPAYTNPCHSDWFYFDNYTNGTTKFTMKVDFMESSGSYNMGLANLVHNCYSKHPLEDYINAGVIDNADKLQSNVTNTMRWSDYRTSVTGYPVMAFHRKSNGDVTFIGLYRMLSDKGSDEMYGFKSDKKVLQKALPKKKTDKITGEVTISYPKLRDVAECWEFSDNNRGYCSFRDPWNREELSFKAPDDATNKYTASLAPIVCDSFEYRYSKYDDALDVIYDIAPDGTFTGLPTTQDASGKYTDDRTATLMDAFDGMDVSNLDSIHSGCYKAMSNWEKACAWVWLTNTENVMSGGTYTKVTVSEKYEKGKYYTTEDNVTYTLCNDEAYDPTKKYYSAVTSSEGTTYELQEFVDADHQYEPSKFYVKSTVDESYILCEDAEFDSAQTYYEFKALTPEEMDAKIAKAAAADATQADKNLVKHTKKLTDRYTADKYPGYLTADGYAYWDTNKEFLYDTQEFRNRKFVEELSKHFDVEYLATYFVITEVLECYDSRGKNCMMASWGPQVEGGDYIWYPIFYDLDTQLGINNTGIPSFTYNVDATDEGNFSTSDSILWNNFYKNFKNSYILMKYKHLKGQTDGVTWSKLSNPPFQSINKIEKWYSADPDECNCIAMRGERPLIVTDLDEYYKYITITNNSGLSTTDNTSGILNTTGYQSSGAEGQYTFDNDGTYFYALQGDRSLSRRQFLTNRFEYVDSWLNQGNYQRGGTNRIRGRVSANYKNNSTGEWYTSDHWLETDDDPYWVNNTEFGTKTHDFDSQYWVTLQPVRNIYVTLGGDANSTYPSKKYSGTPINYKVTEMEKAVRGSNLAEKLLYIYGMNQMSDPGDLYKNYWTEFYLEGNADKLSRLMLGCDGLMTDKDGNLVDDPKNGDTLVKLDSNGRIVAASPNDANVIHAIRWYNTKMNLPTLPSGGLPLLKKANFSNLTIQTKDSATLRLTQSEKLQDFRATGSNFTQITFAKGAALHTLYLPNSITRIDLKQMKLLKNIVTSYAYPKKEGNDYVAEPGLYIQGLTDVKPEDFTSTNVTPITHIGIEGDAMGYDSFKLLARYYASRKCDPTALSTIDMTDVQWTPYKRLVKGDVYDSTKASQYYRDNGHYGFTPLGDNYDTKNFNNDVANGELYFLSEDYDASTYPIGQSALDMFLYFMDDSKNKGQFTSENGNSAYKNPNITGDVYFNNTTAVDEEKVREEFNTKFPRLNVYFAKVNPSNSARFIIPDFDDNGNYLGTYHYAPFISSEHTGEKSIQKLKDSLDFKNPYKLYYLKDNAEIKPNYDFLAWSTSMDINDTSSYIGGADKTDDENQAAWDAEIAKIKAVENPPTDYTYYALFTKHKYNINFYNGTTLLSSVKVTYGKCLGDEDSGLPHLMPTHPNENSLDVYETYKFLGFSRSNQHMVVENEREAALVDYSTYYSVMDYNFYAVYMKVDVHKTATDDKYFDFTKASYTDASDANYNIANGYRISPKSGIVLSGKITFPITHNGLPVIAVGGFASHNITHVFWNSEDYDNPNLRQIDTNAFQNCTSLVFFEFTSKLRRIEQRAFSTIAGGSNSGISDSRCVALLGQAPLLYIGEDAFNTAFSFPFGCSEFRLRGTVQTIGDNGFMFKLATPSQRNAITSFIIGSASEPSVLSYCGSSSAPGIRANYSDVNYISQLTIYAKEGRYVGSNLHTNGVVATDVNYVN